MTQAGELCYPCINCNEEITFERVVALTIRDRAGRVVDIRYTCCSGGFQERRFVYDVSALKRLLIGFHPKLPYVAADYRPRRDPTLPRDMERAVRVFEWEVEHLDSVDEFLLLCSRPPR